MEIFIRGLVALGIALAVAAYGFSDTVVAPAPAGVAAAAPVDAGSGWSPRIQHLIGHSRLPHLGCDSCGGHGKLGHGLGHGGAPVTDPGHGIPRTQPGTVVFPQHPFVRSPRDFFMMD